MKERQEKKKEKRERKERGRTFSLTQAPYSIDLGDCGDGDGGDSSVERAEGVSSPSVSFRGEKEEGEGPLKESPSFLPLFAAPSSYALAQPLSDPLSLFATSHRSTLFRKKCVTLFRSSANLVETESTRTSEKKKTIATIATKRNTTPRRPSALRRTTASSSREGGREATLFSVLITVAQTVAQRQTRSTSMKLQLFRDKTPRSFPQHLLCEKMSKTNV